MVDDFPATDLARRLQLNEASTAVQIKDRELEALAGQMRVSK